MSEPEEQLHCTLPSRTFRSFGTSSNATVPCYLPVLSDSQSNINPLWRREEIRQEHLKKKKKQKMVQEYTGIISASVFLGDNLSQVACQKENLHQPKLQNKNSPKNNRNLMLSIWFLLTSCHLNLGAHSG